MQTKVSVVIPMFNHWDLTHSLLYDLYNWTKGISEVILLDNGSTEKDGRDWWVGNGMLPLKVIRLDENIGFLKAANYGMKQASGDILILISNDVSIKEDVVKRVHDTLMLSDDYLRLVGGKFLNYDTGWNTFDGRTFPYLEGWLLGCLAKDWQMLGGFDERYAPNDFEDVDLSTTAISKGFTLVGLDSPKISHIGGATIKYSPERQALTEINREKFRQKWMSSPKSE